MLVVNDEALWSRAWAYKDHGKSFAAVYERKHPPGYRWLHESFGTNWRLTEMQAVLGRLQLRKAATWVQLRRRNAKRLIEGFSSIECLRVPVPPEHVYHSYYKFYAFLDRAQLKRGWSRDRVAAEIAARGVPCFAGSCSEIYLEKAFDRHPSRPTERLPIARILGETSLMFLVHPTLGCAHMERTVDVVRDVLRGAVRRSRAKSPLSGDAVEA